MHQLGLSAPSQTCVALCFMAIMGDLRINHPEKQCKKKINIICIENNIKMAMKLKNDIYKSKIYTLFYNFYKK